MWGGTKQRNPPVGALPLGAPLGRTRARQPAASAVHWVLAQTRAVNSEGRRQSGCGWGGEIQETLHLSCPPPLPPGPQLFPSPPCCPVNLVFSINLLHYWNFPSPCLLIFLHVISKYPRFLLSVLRRLNRSCANFYRTNITWHTHNCVKKKKRQQDVTNCILLHLIT